MYKPFRDVFEYAKSTKNRGKTFVVDISRTVCFKIIAFDRLLDQVVLYRLDQERTKSDTISGL
jgi:hypothetical protein